MISWFKKPKVVFECLLPGVEQYMPIIPAKDYRHPWTSRALQEFAIARKELEFGTKKFTHVAKCPGIFNLQRQGWIMRTYQDVCIETYGDGDTFTWTSAINQREICKDAGDYVSGHEAFQYATHMQHWGEDTLRTVVKIMSPWRCTVPKGYYLLEMGVAHQDEDRFTIVPGVFSREHGCANLNPQLLWHKLKGKTLIKAGTPIAQYILLPKKQVEMQINVTHTATDNEVTNLVNNHQFVKNYHTTKQIFNSL